MARIRRGRSGPARPMTARRRPPLSRSPAVRFPSCKSDRKLSRVAARVLAGLALAVSVASGATPSAASACRDPAPGVASLDQAAAPRVLALQGSVPFVTMAPFADFLEAMGYPAERLRHPPDGTRTLASFVDARRFAGEIAWHYERDGVMPVLVGHSQGGMVVIKALHELAGRNGPIPVWNPMLGAAEQRTWIIDPRSGARREVTTLRVNFAAALVTGSLPRVLLAQWDVLPLLRDVPDSAVAFTGFAIPWDAIAGTGAHPAPFRATGSALVRNVVLPAAYSHIALPAVDHLARQSATRAWIEAWRPDVVATPLPQGADVGNLLHAADLWYSLRRAWCESAQARAAS